MGHIGPAHVGESWPSAKLQELQNEWKSDVHVKIQRVENQNQSFQGAGQIG